MAIERHATISGTVKDNPRRTDDLLQNKHRYQCIIGYAANATATLEIKKNQNYFIL